MITYDNTNRHFKGQLDTEEVQCFYRKHWIVIVKDLIGFLFFLFVLGFTAFHFKGVYQFFAQDTLFTTFLAFSLVALFTIYIHKFFLRMIRYFLDIVIVTNYRIVVLDKSLYLRDSKDATDLPKIQDIQKSQDGLIKNIFKFGELVITLSSTSTTKTLKFVPNPDYHFRKINKLKREYIKERLGQRHQRDLKVMKNTDPEISSETKKISEDIISGLS
jgi:hypothetical protein